MLRCPREWCGGDLLPDTHDTGQLTCILCARSYVSDGINLTNVLLNVPDLSIEETRPRLWEEKVRRRKRRSKYGDKRNQFYNT